MAQELPAWVIKMNDLGSREIPFLFILDFDLHEPVVIPLTEVSSHCIRFSFNSTSDDRGGSPEKLDLHITPVKYSIYEEGFKNVLNAIQLGDTYLLNLCYTSKLENVPPLEYIFDHAHAPFKLLFQTKFVVFSPERFVKIENGYIRTYPMKGTIDASIPNAEYILLNDQKEMEEHATVVDLLRNDLSIVASDVEVQRYRYITEVFTNRKKLLQCSSEISGKLGKNYLSDLGTIFYKLLPAGSVTGAPKKKTVELIQDIECEPRGYYTGVFGLFDGIDLDSAVMIRMIEERPDGYYYRSGGGITYRSLVSEEYQEMIDKVYIPL